MGGSARRAGIRARRRIGPSFGTGASGVAPGVLARTFCRHRQPRSPCPKRQEDPGSVHRNRRRAGRDHRRREPRRRVSLPSARPRRHRGCQARRLHRGERRLPHRRRPRGRRVHRRRHGGDPRPLQPRCPRRRLPRQPRTPDGRGRAPRRPHRPGPCRRHGQGPGAQALRALGDREGLAARGPDPLRGGEGLRHGRRHQPHRGRRGPRLLHGQPDPHHPRPDHARPQAARRPGQPRGRHRRQVRRAAARERSGVAR